MKLSARLATIFIFLFFLFFNGVQVYLISQRISGAKAKFKTASTDALMFSLFQYSRLIGDDTAARPKKAYLVYSPDSISVIRRDSQVVLMQSLSSKLQTDTVIPAAVEGILNRPRFTSLNLHFLDSLYTKTLDSVGIHAGHRLDSFNINFRTGNNRKDIPKLIDTKWEMKRNNSYSFSINPQRIFFHPSAMIFAEFKPDYIFYKKELLWPMLGFVVILLISNTALVFVYRTIRKQKKINELKTDFINNITHEMKTPITIASAGLEALEHHVPATERTNFYLHTSKKQLRLLNEFVERILDAAVQDIAEFTLKKEIIDLNTLFGELMQSHSIIQEKQVNIKLTAEGPVWVQGDRLHLETAFHNILDNAIKYSGEAVEIGIELVENNRECIIKIRDNGMGIHSQYTKNIFDKFFRVPQGDAQSIKGFGLGLYYVSNIVKKHGGQISVQSKVEEGTEFIITLPKNL